MVNLHPDALAGPAALGVGLLWLAAEAWHARRIRRAALLAFGPEARPRAWTHLAPWLRAASGAAAAWGLLVLLGLDGTVRSREGARAAPAPRDLVVLLDVSPSMTIHDAGPQANISRAARAGEVLRSVLELAPPERVRITMVAFYNGALPLVIQCADREVVWNFLNKMPLVYAFPHGKTDLLKGINKAGEVARAFDRKNATLLLLSDGDSVSDTGLLPLPPAFAGAVLVGVGDRHRGERMDGHVSRQDEPTLRQLARRVSGTYWDGNSENPPAALFHALTGAPARGALAGWSRRMLALFALGGGTLLLALLPALLQQFGARWRMSKASVVPQSSSRPVVQPPILQGAPT